ncbi:MAG: hypothetical protein AB7R89_06200 [Dehalococcoidia bacterium]
MINFDALRIAVRTRLLADATLLTLIGDIYAGSIPDDATWDLPNLEMGVADQRRNDMTGYTRRSERILLRLKAVDQGGAGYGDYGRCYAALVQAEAVLLATPLTVPGMAVVDQRFDSAIPERMPADERGVLWPQVGRLYRYIVDSVP